MDCRCRLNTRAVGYFLHLLLGRDSTIPAFHDHRFQQPELSYGNLVIGGRAGPLPKPHCLDPRPQLPLVSYHVLEPLNCFKPATAVYWATPAVCNAVFYVYAGFGSCSGTCLIRNDGAAGISCLWRTTRLSLGGFCIVIMLSPGHKLCSLNNHSNTG